MNYRGASKCWAFLDRRMASAANKIASRVGDPPQAGFPPRGGRARATRPFLFAACSGRSSVAATAGWGSFVVPPRRARDVALAKDPTNLKNPAESSTGFRVRIHKYRSDKLSGVAPTSVQWLLFLGANLSTELLTSK